MNIPALWSAAVLALTALGASAVYGQDLYPSRTVRFVAGLGAGGAGDIVARELAAGLAQRFGQTFIVENRTGAGGLIAAREVAQSPPDGYRLLLLSSGITAEQSLRASSSFDIRDMEPVGKLFTITLAIFVNSEFPVKNVRELIEYAKQHPGEVKFSSAGFGGATHVAAEHFGLKAGLKLLHVPYTSNGAAVIGLLQKGTHFFITDPATVEAQLENKTLRMLAVTLPARSPLWPDVPTVAEEAIPGFKAETWYGLWAPRGTPKPVIDVLSSSIAEFMNEPSLKAKFQARGWRSERQTPEAFRQEINDEIGTWKDVFSQLKIQRE